jgi:hypothetical protein
MIAVGANIARRGHRGRATKWCDKATIGGTRMRSRRYCLRRILNCVKARSPGRRAQWIAVFLIGFSFLFTVPPPAISQSKTYAIDQPASTDDRRQLMTYLSGNIDIATASIFVLEVEKLRIFRISGKQSCINEKCLTVVISSCAEKVCQHVDLLAEASIFSSPLYVELFGGLKAFAFGNPERPGPILLFGHGLMIVTAGR